MARMKYDEFQSYIRKMSKLCDKAEEEFISILQKQADYSGILVNLDRDAIIEVANAVSLKYGEGAAALACQMYDDMADLSGKRIPPAIPAEAMSYNEVGKVVNGALKSQNDEVLTSAVGRIVKQRGQDTTLQNAKRDGAQCAWVPSGDTCAFCITLASRGWEKPKDGHADHIHANCDCVYAVRFNNSTNYQGYDPDYYRDLYDNTDYGAKSSKDKINAMRRKFYKENKDEINAQKRSAYEKRKELNSSLAEEINID